MRRNEQRLQQAGLGVVLIGLGTPEEAMAFREALKLPFPVLSDPARTAYKRYGLGHMHRRDETSLAGAGRFVGDIVRYGGAYSRDQDMTQLGGTFIVDQSGIIRLAAPATSSADRPELDDLIAATLR